MTTDKNPQLTELARAVHEAYSALVSYHAQQLKAFTDAVTAIAGQKAHTTPDSPWKPSWAYSPSGEAFAQLEAVQQQYAADERNFHPGSPEYWRAMHDRMASEGRLSTLSPQLSDQVREAEAENRAWFLRSTTEASQAHEPLSEPQDDSTGPELPAEDSWHVSVAPSAVQGHPDQQQESAQTWQYAIHVMHCGERSEREDRCNNGLTCGCPCHQMTDGHWCGPRCALEHEQAEAPDLWREIASRVLEIPAEKVTSKQRQEAKLAFWQASS
jgi:hypothetical protein